MKKNSVMMLLLSLTLCGCVSAPKRDIPEAPDHIKVFKDHVKGSFVVRDKKTNIKWIYMREVDLWAPLNYNRGQQ